MTNFNNKNKFLITLFAVLSCSRIIAMQPEDVFEQAIERRLDNVVNYEESIEEINDLLETVQEGSCEYDMLNIKLSRLYVKIEIEDCLRRILIIENKIEKNKQAIQEEKNFFARNNDNSTMFAQIFEATMKEFKDEQVILHHSLNKEKRLLQDLYKELVDHDAKMAQILDLHEKANR